jgi:hypothetical protein
MAKSLDQIVRQKEEGAPLGVSINDHAETALKVLTDLISRRR